METKDLQGLQKEEALKRMKMLKLSPNVIKDFKDNDVVYYSERQNSVFDGILYFISNEPKYLEAVKDFEKENNALVYHAQLIHSELGDMLSLLYVSKSQDEWYMDNEDLKAKQAFAYVVNLDEPAFSEFGTIGIVARNGGVGRTF